MSANKVIIWKENIIATLIIAPLLSYFLLVLLPR